MQRQEFFKKTAAKDASRLRVSIVASRFNADITDELVRGALETLRSWRVPEGRVSVIRVPGSFEIPLGCAFALKKKPNAIVALGCVLRGETDHDRYIAHAVADGIMRVSTASGVPIAFGVITPNTLKQARARAFGKGNHGAKAAEAALEMALMKKAA